MRKKRKIRCKREWSNLWQSPRSMTRSWKILRLCTANCKRRPIKYLLRILLEHWNISLYVYLYIELYIIPLISLQYANVFSGKEYLYRGVLWIFARIDNVIENKPKSVKPQHDKKDLYRKTVKIGKNLTDMNHFQFCGL